MNNKTGNPLEYKSDRIKKFENSLKGLNNKLGVPLIEYIRYYYVGGNLYIEIKDPDNMLSSKEKEDIDNAFKKSIPL